MLDLMWNQLKHAARDAGMAFSIGALQQMASSDEWEKCVHDPFAWNQTYIGDDHWNTGGPCARSSCGAQSSKRLRQGLFRSYVIIALSGKDSSRFLLMAAYFPCLPAVILMDDSRNVVR